jgi:putative transposase
MLLKINNMVTSKKAVEKLGVSPNTLRRWADAGTIKTIRTPAGQRLYLGLDSLYSKMAVEPSKKRKFKLAAERQRWKIFDLIDDLHKKTAHFLVTRFSEIVIPTFETSQMVTKLRSKTARSMLTFAHYRFKQFLLAKAEEYSCKVRIVSEAYTSKTCSYCGRIQNIGSKKVFKCSCGVNADRDLQGARGIYLRALGALPWSEHVLTYNC